MADSADKGETQVPSYKLVPHRDFYLISGIHSPEEVDQIQNWEIRDTDVFAITYPKSGTIWMQQILSLIKEEGDITATTSQLSSERIPWIELIGSKNKFDSASSPRLQVSHLPYKFIPQALREKRGKVIYVARNPKDVLVSYYHFHFVATMLQTPKDFNHFFEDFMEGKVFGNCWFEHIKTWYSHRDEINFLYITYEEMIMDLRGVVERLCVFLGKDLTCSQVSSIVKHSTFQNMRKNPSANYEEVSEQLLSHKNGAFMRKGTVGDWKNYFSEAQNERFDQVFQEKMKDVPLSFVWDISDITTTSS